MRSTLTKPTAGRRSRQRGSALIEFVLCFAVFWVPLFLGTGAVGFSLIRAIEATQVCRDAAHMYAYGTDFSQTGSKDLMVSLAQGLGMTATGGDAVIIFSTVAFVGQADCNAAGLKGNACTNLNHYVFTKRLYIGRESLHPSNFGTPDGAVDRTTGAISSYLTNPVARADDSFSTLIALVQGQTAFMAEMWTVSSTDNYWGSFGLPQAAARFIF